MRALETVGVKPVVAAWAKRLASDAAWVWQQRDASAHSPLLGLGQLLEFDRRLDTLLNGLRAAPAQSWQAAAAEMRRQGSAPDVFVATTLALASPAPDACWPGIWDLVQRRPEYTLRGLIGALAWAQGDAALHQCSLWLTQDPVRCELAVAAWCALALRGAPKTVQSPQLTVRLARALDSPHPLVRAASSRVAARWNAPWLLPLLHDGDRCVRVEAAIGWLAYGRYGAGGTHGTADTQQAFEVLWQACHEQAEALADLTAWSRERAQQRLARWVNELALATPWEHPGVADLLNRLPTRLGLWFVLYHGDGNYLPWVVARMSDPEVGRLAGWVWSALSGVDLERLGLTVAPRLHGHALRPTDFLDAGLPEPDGPRIEALGIELSSYAPCLRGLLLDEAHLRSLLWQAPQALRWIAAKRLARLGYDAIDNLAHARWQMRHALVRPASPAEPHP